MTVNIQHFKKEHFKLERKRLMITNSALKVQKGKWKNMFVFQARRELPGIYIKVRTIKEKTEKHFLTYIWYLKVFGQEKKI